jgi:hypothetical protein
MSPFERWAPYACGAVLAAPVLVARYPPMTDLPLHEALVGLLRHYGDPTMVPPGLYFLNLGEPNQLFHLSAWLLSLAVPTDLACKLVVAATMFAIPAGAARFAAHLGVSRLSAFVVAPIAIGWLFTWGLITNLIGIAALLFVLPWLDRAAQSPSPRRAAIASLGAVVLYFAHESMMIVYGGAALLFALCYPLRPAGKAALRLAPFGAAFLLAVVQARWQKHIVTPTVASVPTWFMPVATKLKRMPDMLLPSGDLLVKGLFAGLCLLAIILFLRVRAAERRIGPPLGGRRERAQRYRFEIFAAACFLAYLVFPFTLNGATLVFERFFAPAFAVFAVVAAPRDASVRAARAARLLAPALPVATLLWSWPMFADADRCYRDLDRILPLIAKDSSIAAIDLGPVNHSRDFSLGPAFSRALATRGGRAHYAFTDSPIAPVMMRPEYQWNEELRRIGMNAWRFRPGHDFTRFRYLLLHTNDPKLALIATVALQPEGKPIAVEGEFVLFESTLPVAPLLSPDVPLPNPPPPTIRKRMKDLMDDVRREQKEPPPTLGTDEEPNDAMQVPGHE